MKFVMSYSCGKDSTLSLYRMIKAGHEPLALLITVDKKVCRSWFHGVPKHLLEEVSKSLNIPLLLVESIGDNYKETFEEALGKAKEQGAEACVFGDIDLGFTTVLKNVKLECLGEEFLGKVLTKELVEKIKATGSDACGENGEYHSFVYDGPLFSYPVSFEVGENILTETHGYLDIK